MPALTGDPWPTRGHWHASLSGENGNTQGDFRSWSVTEVLLGSQFCSRRPSAKNGLTACLSCLEWNPPEINTAYLGVSLVPTSPSNPKICHCHSTVFANPGPGQLPNCDDSAIRLIWRRKIGLSSTNPTLLYYLTTGAKRTIDSTVKSLLRFVRWKRRKRYPPGNSRRVLLTETHRRYLYQRGPSLPSERPSWTWIDTNFFSSEFCCCLPDCRFGWSAPTCWMKTRLSFWPNALPDRTLFRRLPKVPLPRPTRCLNHPNGSDGA